MESNMAFVFVIPEWLKSYFHFRTSFSNKNAPMYPHKIAGHATTTVTTNRKR